MRPLRQPHMWALAIGVILALAVSMLAAFGFGGVLVVALAGLLVGNYLAHRTVATQPDGRRPRHGDNMD